MMQTLYRRLLWHYITQSGEQIVIDRTTLAQTIVALQVAKEQISTNDQP